MKFLLQSFAAIPLPILYLLAKPLYFILFYIARFRRDTAKENIRNSFPELSDNDRRSLLKQSYKNFCEVCIEILKSINYKPEQLVKHVSFKNVGEIENYLKQNKTILLSLAHQCNQEWAILAASQALNYPVDGIYKPLHMQWVNELALESRNRFNITLIPAKTCITDLIKRSKQTRIIAIAPDQAPRRRDEAYWANFLNQDTPFYLGLEKIATLFKYPVFFMDLERIRRGHYHATFKLLSAPPYSKESNVISENYVKAVENQILKQPQDWLWIHNRWKKEKSLYD